MSEPTLSVVIPCGAGREENLRAVLYWLRFQTVQPKEVIVATNVEIQREIFSLVPTCGVTWLRRGQPQERGSVAKNRNAGTASAIGTHLIFTDSDVILRPDALAHYKDAFTKFPNRAIAGLYHWLPPGVNPMRWEPTEEGFDDGVEDAITGAVGKSFSHNVGWDGRLQAFQTTHPDRMYCDYGRALGLLSGNMGISQKCFWGAGGYWEELDFCEDGAFGLALVQAGFNISFSKDVIACHMFHPRHPNIQALSERAMKLIIERFHNDDSWIGKMDTTGGANPWGSDFRTTPY